MPMNPTDAFNLLVNRNSTENFLKTYPVRVFGNTHDSGVAQFVIRNRGDSFRPGSVMRTHNMHATESFELHPNSAFHMPSEHIFPAHSIHMDLGVNQLGFYKLFASGPNVMVTGQLSGCSFVINPSADGGIYVAHIKPVGQTGAQLAAILTHTYPQAFVYGASAEHGYYDSDDRVVSIIGIRDGGNAWSIYAQKQDAETRDYRILSVYKIHPNHSKL
jgi:hypothetical protein